jgi:hypothetical protein
MQDTRILALYRLAREEYAAAISEEQIFAVEELKNLSVAGNTDAAAALTRLKQLPTIHPFLREVLAA